MYLKPKPAKFTSTPTVYKTKWNVWELKWYVQTCWLQDAISLEEKVKYFFSQQAALNELKSLYKKGEVWNANSSSCN